MGASALIDQLSDWIRFVYEPRTPELHCLRLRRDVALPGGGAVGLLAVRHSISASPGAPDHFKAELWDLQETQAGADAVAGLFRKLGVFRAWYSQLLEDAEVLGRKRRHRFSVHANLVAPGVQEDPLLHLLAQYAGEVAVWTCSGGAGSFDLVPYYPGEATDFPNGLAESLDHLPWVEAEAPARC